MVMESDASSISVVYLMIWFSYHKGIQMQKKNLRMRIKDLLFFVLFKLTV